MKLNTIEGNVNPWEYMCKRWNMFAPPGRPSYEDIRIMKEMLNNAIDMSESNISVLLLGATPEIRDMLAENKRITTTLVDITMDMIISMQHLMKNEVDNEIWVKSNWIDVPLEHSYYDVVISDLVICNVPFELHDSFYGKIVSLLKPQGHWINRAYSIDENTVIRSLENLLQEYSKKETLSKEDINNFRSTAGLIAWKKDEHLLDWKLLYEEMKKYQKNGQFIHKNKKYVEILEKTYELFKPFNKKYYLDTKEHTELKMKEYFVISNVWEDQSVKDLHEKGYYIYDLIPIRG